PTGYLNLGVLVLIFTPVARVLLSLLSFLEERDRAYVLMTGIVLTNLLISVVLLACTFKAFLPSGPMDEILAAARSVDWRALGDRALCDACLGRLFGRLGHGLMNQDRGRAVREVAVIADGPCWVCAGLTGRYDDLAGLVARKLGPWEFETFRVGSKIDFEMAAREESLWTELALTGPEALKAEVNREVGKRVSDLVHREAALDRPDVVAVLDTAFDHVDLQVNPLYLRGRYRKLSRGVPQTRWPCRRCRGKGCDRCGGTG